MLSTLEFFLLFIILDLFGLLGQGFRASCFGFKYMAWILVFTRMTEKMLYYNYILLPKGSSEEATHVGHHKYFSGEKSSGHDSHRRAPSLRSETLPSSPFYEFDYFSMFVLQYKHHQRKSPPYKVSSL